MAMGLVALRGLLPSLSGLISDHAALFVSNPELPLSGMPFAPVNRPPINPPPDAAMCRVVRLRESFSAAFECHHVDVPKKRNEGRRKSSRRDCRFLPNMVNILNCGLDHGRSLECPARPHTSRVFLFEPWLGLCRQKPCRGFEGPAKEIPTPPSDHIPLRAASCISAS
jgi:hypothetical protein